MPFLCSSRSSLFQSSSSCLYLPAFFIAANLLIYPPEHVIYGEYAYEDWDAEKITSIINFFVPDNMRVDLLSKFIGKSGGNVHLLDDK